MSGNGRAPAALAARVAALMASFSGPKLWLDPWDVSTLQQDSTGATPVTAAGDPIGRIMDKSGAANHATQATTTSRPLWQGNYAAFDGTDDSWTTASMDFTSTDKVTVIAGVRKMSDAAAGMVYEHGPISTTNGTFFVAAPLNASPNAGAGSRGTVSASVAGSGFASPVSMVLRLQGDIAAPSVQLSINGLNVAGSVASQGTGTYGNFPGNVGRRNNASLPFNGNLYGLISIGRTLTADEISLCERYMASQVGISL